MSRKLVYCDDPSHTADPVGLFITDSNPVVTDDVYLVDMFSRDDEHDAPWHGMSVPTLRGPFYTEDEQHPALLDGSNIVHSWSPKCSWCGQSGGRWKVDDRDAVFSKLDERGITGVSLRALDLIKHSGMRSI